MKKLTTITLLALAIFMASCDNNGTEFNNEKFTIQQINKVTNIDSGSTSTYSAEYTYDIDYVEGTLNITASNVRFNPTMHAISFDMKNIQFTYSDNGINFNSTNIIPEMRNEETTQYTIASLSGRIITKDTPTDNVVLMEMNLNNNYAIIAYPSPMQFEHNCSTSITEKSTDSYPYVNEATSYKVVTNIDNGTATIFINKAQFATSMPAMNMVFNGITLTPTDNGFTLNADNLIPYLVDDTGATTPKENFPISELKGEIINGTLKLKFICSINAQNSSVAGISYDVTGHGNLFPNAD